MWPLLKCSMFSLLQSFDKNILLSIIGYFGVVKAISLHQDQLPACPTGSYEETEQIMETYPEWVSSYTCALWIIC